MNLKVWKYLLYLSKRSAFHENIAQTKPCGGTCDSFWIGLCDRDRSLRVRSTRMVACSRLSVACEQAPRLEKRELAEFFSFSPAAEPVHRLGSRIVEGERRPASAKKKKKKIKNNEGGWVTGSPEQATRMAKTIPYPMTHFYGHT